MAEFMFAATIHESCHILQSILDRGDLYAIEEYLRDPKDAEHITQVTEAMRTRWSEPWSLGLYLFGSYSIYPPSFADIGDGDHLVRSLVAGPCIGLRLCADKKGILSTQNDIFTKAFYQIPNTEEFLTPEQLAPMKEAYADCVKRAKKFLVRYQLKDSEVRLWIGREARELLEQGQLCLYWADKHYSAGKWYPGPRPERWPMPDPAGEGSGAGPTEASGTARTSGG